MTNSQPNNPEVVGSNFNEPVLKLQYYDLTRTSPGKWESNCPKCLDGVLTVKRHPLSLEVHESDSCTLCGQIVKYLDIDKMRKDGP